MSFSFKKKNTMKSVAFRDICLGWFGNLQYPNSPMMQDGDILLQFYPQGLA